MKINIILGLFFWGVMARILSELMALSVSQTQSGLLWLSWGMWGVACSLIGYGLIRILTRGPTGKIPKTEGGHEQ